MKLLGKGFFTFNLHECEDGEPGSILATAQAAGLSHVIIKIADGDRDFGVDASGIDFTAPVVQVLQSGGIAVWGWQTVHGLDPLAEANIAVARTQALNLDGYVVEVKGDYARGGMSGAAWQFMSTVRRQLTVPIALSSYRFPNFHPELPWSTFLEFCDLHMPQITWEQAHNAGAQLRESHRQCASLPNAKPCIPTGAVFNTPGWNPTTDEMNDFLNTAVVLALPAVNFLYWDACRRDLPHLWTTIAEYAWPTATSLPLEVTSGIPDPYTFLDRFLYALNSLDSAQVGLLYDPDAVQVRAERMLTGVAAIQTGYRDFFDNLPTGATFTFTRTLIADDSLFISWRTGQHSGETTLGLVNGKILQDYTFIFESEV